MPELENVDSTKLLRGLRDNLQSSLESLETEPLNSAIDSLADEYRTEESETRKSLAARYFVQGLACRALIQFYRLGEEGYEEIKDDLLSALELAQQLNNFGPDILARHALIDALAATYQVQCYFPDKERIFAASRGFEVISEMFGDVPEDELRHLYRFRPALGRLLHYQAFFAVRTGHQDADRYLKALSSLTDVDYRAISLDPEKIRRAQGGRRRELAYYFEYKALNSLQEDNLRAAVKMLRSAADAYKQPPWEQLRRKSAERITHQLSLEDGEPTSGGDDTSGDS